MRNWKKFVSPVIALLAVLLLMFAAGSGNAGALADAAATEPQAAVTGTASAPAGFATASPDPAEEPTESPTPSPSPSPTAVPPPVDFLKGDLTGAGAGQLEKLFKAWGFKYYAADGKWTAADTYELTLFQRWAGVSPTGKADDATRKKLLSAYTAYGVKAIPRQKLPLEGRYIGIIPGHQSKANYKTEAISPERGSPKKCKVSSGTRGVATKVYEYQVNLTVGLKLRDKLMIMGARVLMARTSNSVNISNGERTRMMNDAGVQVCLSLHCDGNKNKKLAGFHTLIPGKRGYQTGAVLTKSQKFARIVQEESIKSTGAKNKGYSTRRDLTTFNWAKMPICMVEMGYMTNAAEDKRLNDPKYQAKLATGMANAFVRYFKEVK